VLLVDDHTMILEAFQSLLAAECEVVGTLSNSRELLDTAARLRPDVVLIDISMPSLNGIEATRQLIRAQSRIRMIVLTMNEDPGLVAEAFRAGACGYLLKRSASSELLTAIREVMQHRSYVTSLVTAGFVDAMLEPNAGEGPAGLTPRQREVVQLVAEGRSLKEIAAILNISPSTAAFHKYRIMELLHVRTTAEMVQYAVKHHIV
jgi:DNA-binding NarL/FixJ family response regulator